MFHKKRKSRNKAPLEPWTIYQFNLFLFLYVFLQIMYHKDKADKICIQKDFYMQLICKYVNNYILKLQVHTAKILPALHTNCIQASVACPLQQITHPKIWSLFNAEKKMLAVPNTYILLEATIHHASIERNIQAHGDLPSHQIGNTRCLLHHFTHISREFSMTYGVSWELGKLSWISKL